jgi:hypothetical protein
VIHPHGVSEIEESMVVVDRFLDEDVDCMIILSRPGIGQIE